MLFNIKEYVFCVLFLKCASDVFEVTRAKLRDRFKAQGLSDEQINELLIEPDSYGDTFFIPGKARGKNILCLKKGVESLE